MRSRFVLIMGLLIAGVSFSAAENFLDKMMKGLEEFGDALVTVQNPVLAGGILDGQLVDVSDRFPPAQPQIMVWFNLHGVSIGEAIDGTWYYLPEEGPVMLASAQVVVPEDFEHVAQFTLTRNPEHNLPEGNYRVDISFKDRVLASVPFVVAPGPQGTVPVPVPEPAAPPPAAGEPAPPVPETPPIFIPLAQEFDFDF